MEDKVILRLIHTYLSSHGLSESQHVLESEGELFLDLEYLRDLFLNGKFEECYVYLQPIIDLRSIVQAKILYRIGKQHYFECLERHETENAVAVLRARILPFYEMEILRKEHYDGLLRLITDKDIEVILNWESVANARQKKFEKIEDDINSKLQDLLPGPHPVYLLEELVNLGWKTIHRDSTESNDTGMRTSVALDNSITSSIISKLKDPVKRNRTEESQTGPSPVKKPRLNENKNNENLKETRKSSQLVAPNVEDNSNVMNQSIEIDIESDSDSSISQSTQPVEIIIIDDDEDIEMKEAKDLPIEELLVLEYTHTYPHIISFHPIYPYVFIIVSVMRDTTRIALFSLDENEDPYEKTVDPCTYCMFSEDIIEGDIPQKFAWSEDGQYFSFTYQSSKKIEIFSLDENSMENRGSYTFQDIILDISFLNWKFTSQGKAHNKLCIIALSQKHLFIIDAITQELYFSHETKDAFSFLPFLSKNENLVIFVANSVSMDLFRLPEQIDEGTSYPLNQFDSDQNVKMTEKTTALRGGYYETGPRIFFRSVGNLIEAKITNQIEIIRQYVPIEPEEEDLPFGELLLSNRHILTTNKNNLKIWNIDEEKVLADFQPIVKCEYLKNVSVNKTFSIIGLCAANSKNVHLLGNSRNIAKIGRLNRISMDESFFDPKQQIFKKPLDVKFKKILSVCNRPVHFIQYFKSGDAVMCLKDNGTHYLHKWTTPRTELNQKSSVKMKLENTSMGSTIRNSVFNIPDSDSFLITCSGGAIRIFNLQSGVPMRNLFEEDKEKVPTFFMMDKTNIEFFYLGFADGTLAIVHNHTIYEYIPLHTQLICSIDCRTIENETLLITGSADGSLRLSKVILEEKRVEPLRAINPYSDKKVCASFVPNKELFFTYQDNIISLYDLQGEVVLSKDILVELVDAKPTFNGNFMVGVSRDEVFWFSSTLNLICRKKSELKLTCLATHPTTEYQIALGTESGHIALSQINNIDD